MKKNFNPTLRILSMAQGDVIATSKEDSTSNLNGGNTVGKVTKAPSRANSIIASVADQK